MIQEEIKALHADSKADDVLTAPLTKDSEKSTNQEASI